MFDRWTSDIAEVKRAASDIHCLISAETQTGIQAGVTVSVNIREEFKK